MAFAHEPCPNPRIIQYALDRQLHCLRVIRMNDEGGIADTAIISWPKGIKAHGEVRDNYVNVCDVTPTIYDLLGIDPHLIQPDPTGRPLPIAHGGDPIRAVVA